MKSMGKEARGKNAARGGPAAKSLRRQASRTNFVHNARHCCTQSSLSGGPPRRQSRLAHAILLPQRYHRWGSMNNGIVKTLICAALWIAPHHEAAALSQQGHMVSGAIAYEELKLSDARVLAAAVAILSQHPDRGSFEVAVAGTHGDDRARRLFMEAARWPDDIRQGFYDHPTWHYAAKPLLDPLHAPPIKPRAATNGSAIEAFALNFSVLKDPRASAPERAIALCWVFHLVGDIHQPLHAADQYSTAYPQGDHGGGLQFILDPVSHQPISLHWLWDLAGTRASDPASRAAELRAQLPRRQFTALPHSGSAAPDIVAWAAESHALARSEVYRTDLVTGSSEALAPEVPAAYIANSSTLGERRVTLSGYRIADLLIQSLRD
jgi:hypothetical protein